jgi:glycosyltransferase involved in cell wall biosynthesis
MAMEVPCITTPPVGKAIGVSPDLVPVAESAAAFAKLANQYLDNPELRNKVGGESRRFVQQHFNWDECCKPLLLITKEETVLENG